MRLIDADALIAQIEKRLCHVKTIVWLCRIIGEVPTIDAVEVVRCKYCKHFTEGMAVGMCKRNPDKPIIPIPYNHFCSFGERRKGGDT